VGVGQYSRYIDLLWAGRSGDQNPGGGEIFRKRAETHQPPVKWKPGFFIGRKVADA
jgi:hypothetical protein